MPTPMDIFVAGGTGHIFLSRRIQQRLELVCAAEFSDDSINITALGNGQDFQHVGQRELEFAIADVVFQQAVQDLAGFQSEVVAECQLLPLEAIGALKARWRSRLKGSASGWPPCAATVEKSMPRSASCWMISVRWLEPLQRARCSS